MTRAVYIVDGVRTPFCRMGTVFAEAPADDLGRAAAGTLLARTGIDPEAIDEVIFGCVGQPVESANIARVIALRSGVPESVPAMTVQRNCASGFEAITQAAMRIAVGRGEVFLVGGTESMSQYPLLFGREAARKFSDLSRMKTMSARLGAMARFRPADFKPLVSLRLGLTDPVCGLNMGQTAELLARDWGITREDQDQFALRSHLRAIEARARLADEIEPYCYAVNGHDAPGIAADNGPREGQTIEALAKLRPVFEKKHGTVTAGNASQVTDGAAALLVVSEDALRTHNLRPLGRLVDYAYSGCEPGRMGLGPVFAIAELETRSGYGPAEADIIEINEAFAAQVLACCRAAESADFARRHLGRDRPLGEIPGEKLNVNGGAIAFGHPVGTSGTRLALTALKELRRRKQRQALVSLCVGGGQGGALWLEAA
ncbi:MAG TPA: thiolase family protein [Opitutaceae bacterium]